jgi:Ca2+-binding RTX toxin-like protein
VLEGRDVPAVFGLFTPAAGGSLAVFGDAADNTITISRDAAGKIFVNGGAVTVFGGAPTVANTSSISVFGRAGNDLIALDETNGTLPRANLFGGDGNDTLIGGSGNDLLFGQAGNDMLLGKGGNDTLFGGAGNDTLVGGTGDDQMFGEAGDDVMIWNPGDGSDIMEGGAGTDTVVNNGGNAAETYTVTANGSRVRLDRVTPAPFFLDIGTTENLVVNLNGGDDTFTAGNGLAGLIRLTVDGGAGNDTITGGDGNDTLLGGDGNDVITGGRGSDVMFGGAGDDTFVWNPGDGSDTVEGGDGRDGLLFNGANVDEKFDLSANGSRARLTRDVGGVTMDLNGVELVDLNALGGADQITVNDLTGTGVGAVNLNLGINGNTGDGSPDTVIVNSTNGDDNITVSGLGTTANVTGLAASVSITNAEGANDRLVVNALGGDDGVNASTLPAGVIQLTIDGGAGNDTILGSQGADTLLGGDGNDFIQGNQGNDVVFMGAGDDTFQWNPGDGSDTVEGQDGNDQMLFFGANVKENFDISANGSRARLTRDIGNVTMDLNGLERIELRPLGGADNVVVNDLTGTDLRQIELALRAQDGGPDGQADSITVNGSEGDDNITVGGDTGGLRVGGLAAAVTIFDQDPTLDSLTVNGLGGNDVINAQSLKADSIRFTINGGDGNDTITGSDGADLIIGGRGNDVMFGGPGDDTFVWNPGDGSDTIDGQDGTDFLVFNGANVAEKVDIAANGSRVRFTRDIANITMDLNGVEQINFNALGGADQITVHDLTGTGVTAVNLNLGGADGAADTVTVQGTDGNDTATVAGDANGVTVFGLSAQVTITGAEAANDTLQVQAGAGDDAVDASGLAAGAIQLLLDGGDGDDVLVGSPGHDTLLGGAGDDVLIGNGGADVLDGGPGNNTLIP